MKSLHDEYVHTYHLAIRVNTVIIYNSSIVQMFIQLFIHLIKF